MKSEHDKVTPELPGIPEVRRRGRPPKNGVAPMTAAQKQRAYRMRVLHGSIGTDEAHMSRVELMKALERQLAAHEQGADCRLVIADTLNEIVNRYQIDLAWRSAGSAPPAGAGGSTGRAKSPGKARSKTAK